jgi:transglutaminase-like putative cysteine protease
MKLLRSFPLMCFLLVLLGILGLCAAQQSIELLLVAGTLATLSWYVTEGPRGRTLPRWVSTILVVAVALSAVVDVAHNAGDLLGVLGRVCVWLTLIKLYERRSARDHAHLMALSLLLMLIGCLRSQGLLFGVILFGYAALGLYVLLLYQLYAAHESVTRSRRTTTTPSDEPGPPMGPTIGRHVVLQFRSLALGIGLAGVLLSVGLFVIFPRNVGEAWTVGGRPLASAQTGFTDQIDLLAGDRISDSSRVVFEVQLMRGNGKPLGRRGVLLLRGAVLDSYHEGRWSATGVKDQHIDTTGVGSSSLGSRRVIDEATVLQEFRFRDGTSMIFTLYLPVSIETDVPHRFAYDGSTQTLRSSSESGPLWSYVAGSVNDPTDQTVADVYAPRLPHQPMSRSYMASAGDGVDEIIALAHELLREAGVETDPPDGAERWSWNRRAAETFSQFLQSGDFEYTLDMTEIEPSGRDPIAQFLLQTRAGHCEYFASGLAALCHCVGVEARVVSGFVATEYDDNARRYVVRERHAHAWVEVPIGAYVHEPMDPTPPGVLQPTLSDARPLSERLGWFYDRLDSVWGEHVIGYDDREQSRLLESVDVGVTQPLTRLLEATREWMRNVNRAFSLGPAGYVWLGIVAFAGVLAVLSLIKIIRRIRDLRRAMRLQRLRDAHARRMLRQLSFYLDMLIVLRRGGMDKPAWQPPLAYARVVAGRHTEIGKLVRQITDVYYEGRYGARALDEGRIGEARTWVLQLAHRLGVRP